MTQNFIIILSSIKVQLFPDFGDASHLANIFEKELKWFLGANVQSWYPLGLKLEEHTILQQLSEIQNCNKKFFSTSCFFLNKLFKNISKTIINKKMGTFMPLSENHQSVKIEGECFFCKLTSAQKWEILRLVFRQMIFF